MKKLLITFVCVSFIVGILQAQNGKANIEHKGKLLFINAIPANAYTVVGKAKFENSNKNIEKAGVDPTGIKKVAIGVEDALKKVEKGKQVDFDAVIVYSPIKMELIKFSSGSLSENALCMVGLKDYSKKCGSKDIFFLSIPVKEYEVVKEVEVKNFTNLGQMKMGKNDIDNFLNKLYERSCKEAKEGVDFDAILLVDDNIVINGFISAKNLLLVKYK